jgi:hypothetical protein
MIVTMMMTTATVTYLPKRLAHNAPFTSTREPTMSWDEHDGHTQAHRWRIRDRFGRAIGYALIEVDARMLCDSLNAQAATQQLLGEGR